MSNVASAKPINPMAVNTPATAPLLLQNGFGFEELCAIDNDVVVGVTDVKIVTITTPPHLDSNWDIVGGTIVATTSVDVCCVQVVVDDVVEGSGTNFDAHVELVASEDAAEELISEETQKW